MITLQSLLVELAARPSATIEIALPDGRMVPPHFHVTEIGFVRKDFIDCGGTVRSTSKCVIQVWIADDLEHRLDSTKLQRIIGLAAPILNSYDLGVEVEYEAGVVSQYPIKVIEPTKSGIMLRLEARHTACLATDICGVIADRDCCGTSNCC